MWPLHPLLILLVGIVIVVGLIVRFKINAFIALILAAIAVSLLSAVPEVADGEVLKAGYRMSRVGEAFGTTAGNIAIVIAMAAVIGQCMMESGAADRIVRSFLRALGEKNSGAALASSGFVLSIPVFFDTVFYLLVPLARSLYRNTNKHYLKYIMAITAGGAVTHTLVPPTPGPLAVADMLNVDMGLMILVGIIIGIPASAAGLAFATWMDKRMPIEMRPLTEDEEEELAHPHAPLPDKALPALGISLLPIIIPVILISSNAVVSRMAKEVLALNPTAQQALDKGADTGLPIVTASTWTMTVGNSSFALILSAACALSLYFAQCRPTRERAAEMIEQALMSAGMIILITAGGGAFGAMLKAAGVGQAIQDLFGVGGVTGLMILPFAFFISSLLKFAQGSSTVAMITTAGMIAAMVNPAMLGFNAVYLATAIGGGSLVGSWMNDSGFWIYSKMGGVTEVEALKTWTPLLALLGTVIFISTMLLALVLPMSIK